MGIKFAVYIDGECVGKGDDENDARGYAEQMVRKNPGSRVELREVQESIIGIWETPAKPAKREFLIYPESGEYREITNIPQTYDPDEEGVLTSLIEEEVQNRMITTVRCEIYYGSEGVFELHITRPPEQAMAIYLAALKADDELESGLRKPTLAK